MQARRLRTAVTLAAVAALTVGAAGCAESDRSDNSGEAKTGGTFIFAGAGDPKNFDPIFNDDGESFRPVRQMFDTLISHKPGTAELQGGLAESWEHDPDGKVWTFKLRQGVKFHDGTPFNATAVCFNFDRWYNMKGAAAQSKMIYYMDGSAGSPKTRPRAPASRSTTSARRRTVDRRPHPQPVQGCLPGRLRADLALDREPRGAEEVRRQHGEAERRLLRVQRLRRPPTRSAPAVHLRRLGQGQERDHPEPKPGLLGRQGQGRQDDHQDHQGREHPQAGAARRHRPRASTSRPRPTARRSRSEGFQVVDRAGLQHPLHGDQPEEQPAIQGPADAPGDRLRDQR